MVCAKHINVSSLVFVFVAVVVVVVVAVVVVFWGIFCPSLLARRYVEHIGGPCLRYGAAPRRPAAVRGARASSKTMDSVFISQAARPPSGELGTYARRQKDKRKP